MRNHFIPALLMALLSLAPLSAQEKPMSLYDFKTNSLEGKPADLAEYKGKVVLVVNVASKCGNTPQYTGLEKLYGTYKDKGFVILGFPCNDFGGQEPGTPAEIQTFCTSKYNVTFPMFKKVAVKGTDVSPIYQFLETGYPAPEWNFHKYLIGKDGKVIESFSAKTQPEDPKISTAIEAALK